MVSRPAHHISRPRDWQYIISERLFHTLPADEKKYYHSHAVEVSCGLLQLVELKGVPTGKVTEAAEEPIMTELHKTYGSAFSSLLCTVWARD